MDFSVIFQLRTKKFWWMDVIFYFVMSLFIATVLCYLIFLLKNSFLRNDIRKAIEALKTVGTEQQKEYEKDVVDYQRKIIDFTQLFKNHRLASNAFALMQSETMPNVWFNQFTLDQKNGGVQLSGESDNMEAFSRQVANFEKSKYINYLGTLSSSLGQTARIKFNLDLSLNQDIFGYLADMAAILQASNSQQQILEDTIINPATGSQQNPQTGGQNLITSFHLLLDPEVIGTIDQTNYTIMLDVPYGTDVKNLTPLMVISPETTVSPESRIAQDFTNPVIYTVFSQGSTQSQSYMATVNILPKEEEKQNQQKKSAFGVIVFVIIAVVVIALIAVVTFFAWKKMKAKNNSLKL